MAIYCRTYWKEQFKYDFQFCYVHMLVYMIQPQPMFFSQCDRPSFKPTQNKGQHYSSEHLNLYIFGQDKGRQQEFGQNC